MYTVRITVTASYVIPILNLSISLKQNLPHGCYDDEQMKMVMCLALSLTLMW